MRIAGKSILCFRSEMDMKGIVPVAAVFAAAVLSGCGPDGRKDAGMTERNGEVTMKGRPLTLAGELAQVGQTAPDFVAVANDLSEVRLSSFRGKVVLVSAVPSLDTGVCSLQTKRFNRAAAGLGDDVVILTISMDLPFAQKRWCGAEGVANLQTLSDHRDASFGTAYGVLIKELRLLARSVFVVDRDGRIAYVQIVKELTEHPDYDAALAAVKNLTQTDRFSRPEGPAR